MSTAESTVDRISLHVIPAPSKVQMMDGQFAFGPVTTIVAGKGFRAEAEYLAQVLSPALGLSLSVRNAAAQEDGASTIAFVKGESSLGAEGYRLEVRRTRITIAAIGPAGAFYACQTLRQLLPPRVHMAAPPQDKAVWAVPCMRIEDEPRFPWRGLMLDPAREFLTKEFIKRYIDLLAFYKLNRLHLHLTDDQAWTVEVGKYPQLTDMARWQWKDADRVRGVYSRADIREIVEYAASRHVMVVPEIEMPAHAVTALASMPELMCPSNQWRKGERKWDDLPEGSVEFCMGSESTFEFFDDVLDEFVELFPSPYIHIGGDEYYGTSWAQCPLCRRRQEQLLAEDSLEVAAIFAKCKGEPKKYLLYRYGMRRVAELVAAKGRTPVMWDDMSWQGRYPAGAVVNQWHYAGGHDYWQLVPTVGDPGAQAVAGGHDFFVSSFSHLYFDYSMDDIPLKKVYEFEAVSLLIAPENLKRVLGAHAPVWSQRQENVDTQTFPRLLALAEINWTPANLRNWSDFHRRSEAHRLRLDMLGVRYARGNL